MIKKTDSPKTYFLNIPFLEEGVLLKADTNNNIKLTKAQTKKLSKIENLTAIFIDLEDKVLMVYTSDGEKLAASE